MDNGIVLVPPLIPFLEVACEFLQLQARLRTRLIDDYGLVIDQAPGGSSWHWQPLGLNLRA